MLVEPEVIWGTGQCDVLTAGSHNVLYLVEDVVGIRFGMVGGLRQVGHHDSSVLVSFRHLMQIDKDFWIAMGELNVLIKPHRCVAMRVEGQYALVNMACLTILCSLLNQPLEDGQSFVHTFGMPLHTDDALVLSALHAFDDAVGSLCRHPELVARFTDGLMVEGVDI